MKLYKLYKNTNNTDVAFMPTYTTELKLKDSNMYQGYWYNIVNPKNVFALSTDQIIIRNEDEKNWELYYV